MKRNEKPLARGNIKFIQESWLTKEIIADSLEEINGSDYRKICIVAITSKKYVKNIYKSKDKKMCYATNDKIGAYVLTNVCQHLDRFD